MHQPFHRNYIDFFVYFNGNEDYFECHEVFEELWKEVAPRDKEHVLVGFIQIATGLYHWRRGNLKGAERSIQKGIKFIEQSEPSVYTTPIELKNMIQKSKKALCSIQNSEKFIPFSITFKDEALAKLVAQKIENLPASDPYFIRHKHMLRDRSTIIAERNNRLAAKQTTRQK